ncbi:MAG: 5-formyltetrahydrofolate cyclo-ligase [Ruminococcaceae bacterium]|nr:5-formyltetrahydrofolate cyclo-ligase [Oscillospiraceae bacterium]
MPFSPVESEEQRLKRQKKALRAHYRMLRKQISPESRNLLDSALLANLAGHSLFQRAEKILFYYPVKGEPNLLPLVKYALQLKKTVAFPRSDTETYTLSFHRISELKELSLGAYDIPEPPEAHPMLTDFSDALCIVPALAFDRFGYRLGQGKGFYDRFLATFNGTSVGLLYGRFLTDQLPHDQYDRSVDLMITEKGDILPYEEKPFK